MIMNIKQSKIKINLKSNLTCNIFSKWPIKRINQKNAKEMHAFFQPENERISECAWLIPILQDSLRHIYQRFILETDGDVVDMAYKVECN